MGYFAVFLIAVSLAMDAFAVSVTNGIMIRDFRRRHAVKMGLYFGAFQFIMPIAGYVLGSGFQRFISAYDHWVAFILLAAIGTNMLIESFKKEDGESMEATAAEMLKCSKLTLLAVATSIDALAVGISFAVVGGTNIFINAAIIGAVAFVISYCGGMFGKKLGEVFKKSAERLGGVILIGIGVKILIEHLL